VEQALTVVGITKERVERWLGRPCGCTARKEKLNALGSWAKRILKGNTKSAKKYLKAIMNGEESPV
jgi:hypothetical protein